MGRLWTWLKGGDGVWITAALVGSGIASGRWDYVTHAARCGRVTLIHTLPHLPRASHMGGHLSTLAKCEGEVYASIHPRTHTLTRRGVKHLHHTHLHSWLTPSKTSGIDRSMQLGKCSVAAAAAAEVVCVYVCLYSACKKNKKVCICHR